VIIFFHVKNFHPKMNRTMRRMTFKMSDRADPKDQNPDQPLPLPPQEGRRDHKLGRLGSDASSIKP
jgi:hypothetical protein